SLGMLRNLLREGAIEVFREPYEDRRAFSNGQALFAMRSSSGLLAFRTDIESGLDFDWDVATVPYEGPGPVNNIYGSSISVCRSTAQKELASWLFLKWFTQPAQQTRWVQGSIYFPVRRSAVQGYDPYIRRAYTFLGRGKSEPSLPRYEEVRKLVAKAMVDVLNGQDMDRVLSRLEWEANQTLPGS
ncbi:MAG: extracellular solute-binding protein, partial [Candidatus Latescibacterota bacterium]